MLAEQANFSTQHGERFFLIHCAKTIDSFLGYLFCLFGVVIEKGQQGLGKARQIPLCDSRLVGVSVAPHMVNGAEYRP